MSLDSALPAPRRTAAALGALTLTLAASLAGCDDATSTAWAPAPDTVVLTSLAAPTMNAAAGFDLIGGVTVVLEAPGATGTWDLYVDSRGDSLVLAPPGVIRLGSEAGMVALPGLAFDDVAEAPGDDSVYVTDAPLALRTGTTYVVRTRGTTDYYGYACQYFGKLSPVSLDPVSGRVVLVWDRNPYCYDLDLDGSET